MSSYSHPFLVGFVAFVISAAAGCGGSNYAPARASDPASARQALTAALDTWKSGAASDSLASLTPKAIVSDEDWKGGKALKNYGGGRPGGTTTNPSGEKGTSPSGSGGFGRGNEDPAMTLDYRFKTSLFWIASRANNCQYCLGHQESKLLSAGMTEDQIAALDSDWAEFSPAEQAAFVYARRLSRTS